MVQDRIYSYFENNAQLHVLFIFDQMGIVSSELEGVTWPEGYIYKEFDGAWFNAKYAIEHTWKAQRVVLLFGTKYPKPMTEDQQLHFPLMDMLRANMIFERENYASFMQQHDIPEKFRNFVSKHIDEMTSAKMQNMIGAYYNKEGFSRDVVCRGFISNYLGEKKLLEWPSIVAKTITLGAKAEEKKRVSFFNRVGKNADVKAAIDEQLQRTMGRTYNPNSLERVKELAQCLKYNSITQLLIELPNDNYKQLKVTNQMMLDAMNKVNETGHNSYAEKFDAAIAELASDIREEEIINTYGIDAQYFYMTEELCWPILESYLETKLTADPAGISERLRSLSMKLPANGTVQIAISFVEKAAQYYDMVKGIDTLKLNTPQDYVDRYAKEYYKLDTYYRQALESYHKLIVRDFPIMETVNEIKRQFDQDYAKLVNVMNLEWMTCIKEQGTGLGSIKLPRQQDFFNNERDANLKQVVIISDALRYEVAQELMQELAKERHVAEITPYLAMLPTETKYCKNALLPHQSLTLKADAQPVQMLVDGNKAGTLKEREKVVTSYQPEALCLNYLDVMSGDKMANRELFKHPLVYIYHDTIDENGHNDNPFDLIRACREAINQLAVLIKRIHATWNVRSVILTSDHGFIYNDMQFGDKDKHQIQEPALESKTRYYLSESNAPVEGVVKFPLDQVSGIITKSNVNVAVPEGTNRFAAPGGYSFAHGGATLQEMIIPVIRSTQRRSDKTEKVGISLMSHNLNVISSRLKFQVIQSEAVTMTVQERSVVCCIYEGDKRVSSEQVITLNSHDATNLNNRVQDVTLTLNSECKGAVLQLRIYDVDDELNPLIKETVKNNTLIERDF